MVRLVASVISALSYLSAVAAFSPAVSFAPRGAVATGKSSDVAVGVSAHHGRGCPCGACSRNRHGASCRCGSCSRAMHSVRIWDECITCPLLISPLKLPTNNASHFPAISKRLYAHARPASILTHPLATVPRAPILIVAAATVQAARLNNSPAPVHLARARSSPKLATVGVPNKPWEEQTESPIASVNESKNTPILMWIAM